MATIIWHPHGCGSGSDLVTLVEPGALATGICAYNDGAFANSNPAGGYEIQGMPATESVVIRQSPPDSVLCGQEIIAVNAENGCYDYPSLGNRI